MDRRRAARKTLAERLSELRLAAGKPSYSSLARRSPWLSKSTIGDVLTGHSTPSLEFVLSFVDACQRHAVEADLAIPAEMVDLAIWRAEWTSLERTSRNAGSSEDEPVFAPPAWTVPPRSRSFVGREALLVRLRESLQAGHRTAVHALHGIGGIGKTALAVEYAHRFAPDYRRVWWINAERPDLIGEQLAALAVSAGLVAAEASTPTAVAAARSMLTTDSGWLVVLDNCPSAEAVIDWVPQGPGHVLITSRSPQWTGVAARLAVDVFIREESLAFLTEQVPALSTEEAERVAAAIGDLPLGLTQAAGIMVETGMGVPELLGALVSAADSLLSAGKPADYPAPLAAATRLAASKLASDDPAAAQLANLCALLAPEPIPVWLFTAGASVMPDPLSPVASDVVKLRHSLGALARYGLAQANADTVIMHRLTQAVLRDAMRSDHTRWRAVIDALLVAARPQHGDDPAGWPKWTQLMPHILASDPATTDNRDMMYVAYQAVAVLHRRGDYVAALPIAEHLYERWRQLHGDDDLHVLFAAQNIAYTQRSMGRYDDAHRLDDQTLACFRRKLGDDHKDTLISANDLAMDLRRLGRVHEALILDEDTLERRRRTLGDDHSHTLGSANNVAANLYLLGDFAAARPLHEDVLARKRRVLGEDHPSTLSTAGALAQDLRALGQVEEALVLEQDMFTRCRRVLGDDHPDTLETASNLAASLRALERIEEAIALGEDTLTRYQRVLGDNHPDTLSLANNLAADRKALRGYNDRQ